MLVESVNQNATAINSYWGRFAISLLVIGIIIIVIGILLFVMSQGQSAFLIFIGFTLVFAAYASNAIRKEKADMYVAIKEKAVEVDKEIEEYNNEQEEFNQQVRALIQSKEYLNMIDAEIDKSNDDVLVTLKIDGKLKTIQIKYDDIIFEGDTQGYTNIKDFLEYKLKILSDNDGEYIVAIKNQTRN